METPSIAIEFEIDPAAPTSGPGAGADEGLRSCAEATAAKTATKKKENSFIVVADDAMVKLNNRESRKLKIERGKKYCELWRSCADCLLKRENSETPFCEMVSGVLKNHEKFVLLVENVDFGDTLLRKLVADGFENAKFGTLGQGIIILTNGEDQKNESVMKLVLQISENENKPTLELSSSPCLGNKRRAELDLFGKIMKNPRIEENEEGVLVCAKGNKKREFSRQSSFNNTLDLNMEADEEDEDDEGQNSPISSDLTRETVVEPLISNESLDSIENFFEFNGSPIKDKEVKEVFKSRVKESFEEVFGKNCVGKFSVQDKVIEEIGVGCGSFTNKMFEKWLKDIFQKSLEGVISNGWGKGGIVFTLCWDGKEDRKWDSGFMGSCLPKNIQVVNNFMD